MSQYMEEIRKWKGFWQKLPTRTDGNIAANPEISLDKSGTSDTITSQAINADAKSNGWVTMNGSPVFLEEGDPVAGPPNVLRMYRGGGGGSKPKPKKPASKKSKTSAPNPEITHFVTSKGTMRITSDLEINASESKKVKMKIKAGGVIEGVYSFAGKGSKNPLVVAGTLAKTVGGKPRDWAHKCGFADVINPVGKVVRHEIHWFENDCIGQYDFEIKYRGGSK